jgi:hypothetical protein
MPGASPQNAYSTPVLNAIETRVTATVAAAMTRIFARIRRERCGSAVKVGWIVPCRYS